MQRLFPVLLIATFVLVALFGAALTLPIMHSHHTICPTSVDCVGATHIDHWQSAFVTLLTELAVYAACIILFYILIIGATQSRLNIRVAHRARTPARPPLLQELFSNGILNRKEPAHA